MASLKRPTISNCDVFRALFATGSTRFPAAEMPTLWNQFRAVYEAIRLGRLKITPELKLENTLPLPQTLPALGLGDTEHRLFGNFSPPQHVELFKQRDPVYQCLPLVWTVFEACIGRGDITLLDEKSGTINWDKIYDRVQGFLSGVNDDARQACGKVYAVIHPIVELWLWEKRLDEAREDIHRSIFCTDDDVPTSTYKPSAGQVKVPIEARIIAHPSLCLSSTMEELTKAFRRLNKYLLPPCDDAVLSQLDNPPSSTEYIRKIAQSSQLRVLARLLPIRPALILAGVVQWVLDETRDTPQIALDARSDLVKLLQDIAQGFPVGVFPAYMKLRVQSARARRKDSLEGSEAWVEVAYLDPLGHQVAVRNQKLLATSGDPLLPYNQLILDKRHKRAVIQQRQLSHENLVRILGVADVYPDSPPAVVMTYLHSTLRDSKLEDLTSKLQVVYDVLSGVRYLHSHNVVHGDLHWSNIMYNKNTKTWVLTDFGFSRIARQNGTYNSTTLEPFTSRYDAFMPPEVRNQDPLLPQTLKPEYMADIYSCGIVLLAVGLAPLPAYPTFPETDGPSVSSEKEEFEANVAMIQELENTNLPLNCSQFQGFSPRGSELLWGVVVHATQQDGKARGQADELWTRGQSVWVHERWVNVRDQ